MQTTTKRAKRSYRGNPEVKAVQKVYDALKPVQPEQREKVINSVMILLQPNVEPIMLEETALQGDAHAATGN